MRAVSAQTICLVTLLGVTLATPAGASAQGVVGQVREEATGAPLSGVLVSALREDGTRVAAVLTDSIGRFVIRVEAGAPLRLRAERIGMATAITARLEPRAGGFLDHDITMGASAVELEGLVVGAPVQNCRVSSLDAPRIQRWWDEARKALDVASVVLSQQLVRFRIFQFEREWAPDLRSLRREEGRRTTAYSSRPFVSLEAEELEREGYVLGPPGARIYHAPDAEVLLSPSFLATHCFSLGGASEHPHWVGLMFEPTRSRKVIDISGTFWVDTLTSELKALDYLYSNLPDDIPGDRAGGRLDFRYLPSGAWIVPQWWIRLPRVGMKTERVRGMSIEVAEVVGYVDTGGRAEEVVTQASALDGTTGWGRISGTILDSLTMRPLAGARVQISGTRLGALTRLDGSFTLDSIPEGVHSLTFFRSDLAAAAWPSPVIEVTVKRESTSRVELAVPSFRRFASALCRPAASAQVPESLLVLRVLDAEGKPMERALVQARWQSGDPMAALAREIRSEMYSGSSGGVTFCDIPAEVETQLRVKVGERWEDLLTVVLPTRELTVKEVRVGGSP